MSPQDLPPQIGQALPGVAGALVSLMFNKDAQPQRLALFLSGSITAYFGTPWAAKFSGLDTGLAGFLLGMFSMAVIARLFEAWQTLELTAILRDWVRKTLGLPAKES